MFCIGLSPKERKNNLEKTNKKNDGTIDDDGLTCEHVK
jgi:hypothetical protein